MNPPTFRSGRMRTCFWGGFTAAGRALFPSLCGPAGRTTNRNRFGQKHALRYARQSKARQHFCCEKTVSKREKLSGAFPKDQKPRPSPGKKLPRAWPRPPDRYLFLDEQRETSLSVPILLVSARRARRQPGELCILCSPSSHVMCTCDGTNVIRVR